MSEAVWIVSSYDKGGNAGFVIEGVFDNKAAAEAFVAQDPKEFEVEEYELWAEAPKPWTYWHRAAEVYPDGSISQWTQKHTATGVCNMPPVDDHLDPWDGHTQGHCGLHISIFGTDRQAIETAFEQQLATARQRLHGTCLNPRCGKIGPYGGGFWGETRTRRGNNILD